ncbi:hypothetical protein [Vibrio scophthalmi]|uniref:hypothetical protein n=1 Tax=Vibrio scophthalmi TaxID=45658 RepID=UPI00158662D6|nr:hypothetical protein [Vibrio scophthalmi]
MAVSICFFYNLIDVLCVTLCKRLHFVVLITEILPNWLLLFPQQRANTLRIGSH